MLQFLTIRMYCRFHILISRLRAIFYRVDIQVYNIRFIFLLNLDIWLAYRYEHISFLTFCLNKRAFKDNIRTYLVLFAFSAFWNKRNNNFLSFAHGTLPKYFVKSAVHHRVAVFSVYHKVKNKICCHDKPVLSSFTSLGSLNF